ncbi:hypothetical protein OH76DRAFT_1478267 [Lentinus brumalis]|uniref:Uncharacterized protein n=1 Tax=Lentinus brumalis TaxID=2498619 RepID=A0A371DT22_9APHY|nr:hypothetical protein OH76DRAFT_1478267 [Polyporus brumalis]
MADHNELPPPAPATTSPHPLDDFLIPSPVPTPSNAEPLPPSVDNHAAIPFPNQLQNVNGEVPRDGPRSSPDTQSFTPAGNPLPPTAMGNTFSTQPTTNDAGSLSPTPAHAAKMSVFSFNQNQTMGPQQFQWPPALHPSGRLDTDKPPRKRQRSLSSPSPPRPLIANDYPARAHPGTVLMTGPEGTTLSDSLYGPQTANATTEVKRRKGPPPLVSSEEYNDRVQWRAAYLFKKSEGIDTFNYSSLTGVEPGVPADPNAPTPDRTAIPDAATYRPAHLRSRSDAVQYGTPRGMENAPLDNNVSPPRNVRGPSTREPLLPGAYINEPDRLKPPGNPLFTYPEPQGYYEQDNLPPQWTATQAMCATQQSPTHPLRRLIKSPALDPEKRLFRTDHYNNIDKYPELNPNRPAPYLEVARTRAQFAQELIPTTLLPAPPKPENLFLPTTMQAVSSVNARPSMDPDSLMPVPPDGGPAIHTDNAWGRFRGLSKTKAEYILSLPKDKTVVFNVWGSRGDISTIYEEATYMITAFLRGRSTFKLIPPEGEWGRKAAAPNALNAASLWCIVDLSANDATALVNQFCLSKQELTIFCYRPVLENPHFLLRAGNFVSKNRDLIKETLQAAFMEPGMRMRTTTLLQQNPNYTGLDQDQAFFKFLTTIELDFKEVRMGSPPRDETVVTIFCDPPSNNPDRWLQWARPFRTIRFQHPEFLNSATVLPPIRCAGCHSVDHYIDQCAWPELAEWRAPVPNTASAAPPSDWNVFQRFGPASPRASTSTSRGNDNRRSALPFGFGKGFGFGGGGGNGRSTPNNNSNGNSRGSGGGFNMFFGRNAGV